MRPALPGQDLRTKTVRERLRHVYWLGGASGAGKSTIARRLADQYGLSVYDTDHLMSDHARRLTAAQAPYLAKFAAMDMDERWVTRSPKEMLDTFHWFHGEGFHLIVEDLLGLPPAPGVIVEGFRLLPHLVQPLLHKAHQAVWLLPTPGFRRAVFDGRGGAGWDFLARTSDPRRALHNLLERDQLFAERLAAQVAQLELPMIAVDPGLPESQLLQRVAKGFGLLR